jgi:hypothetical protein
VPEVAAPFVLSAATGRPLTFPPRRSIPSHNNSVTSAFTSASYLQFFLPTLAFLSFLIATDFSQGILFWFFFIGPPSFQEKRTTSVF